MRSLGLGAVALLALSFSTSADALPRDASIAKLEAAAMMGDAEAALRLGQRYEHAEGVARDYRRALSLYCDAARRGEEQAAYNIAWMHLNGRGVKRDDSLASAWLRRAAAGGHPHAEKLLDKLPPPAGDPEASCPKEWEPETLGAAVAPPKPPKRIANLVRRLAPDFGLDPALVLAVIAVESGFDPSAVSPRNARGLMQLLPATARRFGVQDPFAVAQNLTGGMRYLSALIRTFEGDLTLALAAY